MQYMLIHVQPTDLDHEMGQTWQHDTSLTAWLEETIPSRVNLQGSRLRPSSDATTVRSRKGELLVTDGPFAETKEQLAVTTCSNVRISTRRSAGPPSTRPSRWAPSRSGPCSTARRRLPLPVPKEGRMRYVLLVCLGEDFQMGPAGPSRNGAGHRCVGTRMDGRGARLFGSQLEAPTERVPCGAGVPTCWLPTAPSQKPRSRSPASTSWSAQTSTRPSRWRPSTPWPSSACSS